MKNIKIMTNELPFSIFRTQNRETLKFKLSVSLIEGILELQN